MLITWQVKLVATLIAVALAIAGATALWWGVKSRIEAPLKAEIKEIAEANSTLVSRISGLEESGKRFDALLIARDKREADNQTRIRRFANDLAKLKKENAAVRAWADGLVPDAAVQLRLGQTPSPNGAAGVPAGKNPDGQGRGP